MDKNKIDAAIEAKAAEIGAVFNDALQLDEKLQAAIQKREVLCGKQRRLEDGIVALQVDLEKTEAAIAEDRFTLADGSAADVVKLNKRISVNMALLETTKISIEAMQAQVKGMGRELKYADEDVGSAVSTVIRGFFDAHQMQVHQLVEQAIVICRAFNQAANRCVRDANGKTTESSRPYRLHLGDAGDLFQFIENHQVMARTLPAATLQNMGAGMSGLGSFQG